MDVFTTFTELVLKGWNKGGKTKKGIIIVATVLCFTGVAIGIYSSYFPSPIIKIVAQAIVGVGAFLLAVIAAHQSVLDHEAQEKKIASVEKSARENPEKPQLAWDLARSKLESYLDRNLSQVRSIYWLTIIVMFCGFGFILYGLYLALLAPANLPVSVVAAASGVIVSFIGGSFLLVYRSILSQSRDYVTVLERINAVGMAVQVIANIPEASAELKHTTTADLAKQLLNLYAERPASAKV